MDTFHENLAHQEGVVMVFVEGMERSQSFANHWYRSLIFHYASSSWSGWVTQSHYTFMGASIG